MKGSWKLHVGDAETWLSTMAAEGVTVQTCISSPPYFGARDYKVEGQIGMEATPKEYVARLVNVFEGVRRVLRDDGTLWVVIGDSYASSPGRNNTNLASWSAKNAAGGGTRAGGEDTPSRPVPKGLKQKDLIGIPWMLAFALRDAGWYLRQEIIWAKSISGPVYRGGSCMPESVQDRCTRAHETIFMLSKSPRYYFDYEAIKEKALWKRENNPEWQKSRAQRNVQKGAGNRNAVDGGFTGWSSEMGRNRRSVWHVNPKPFKGAHFATFPPELIEPMVLAGCPKGGVVLDPFAGAATTGVVATQRGRHFIGIELNQQYVQDIAVPRLQAGERWAPPKEQDDQDQMSLFGEV